MLNSLKQLLGLVSLIANWLKERNIRQDERNKINAEQDSNAKDAKIISLTPKSITDKLRYLRKHK